MTPFRRRLLAKKSSGEPLFYQTALISGNTAQSTQIGDSLSWVSGQKYHFVFDWEVTAVADSTTSVQVRSSGQEYTFFTENNATVGQTGHTDATYSSNFTRNRSIFVLRRTNDKNFSINITNLKIYLAT